MALNRLGVGWEQDGNGIGMAGNGWECLRMARNSLGMAGNGEDQPGNGRVTASLSSTAAGDGKRCRCLPAREDAEAAAWGMLPRAGRVHVPPPRSWIIHPELSEPPGITGKCWGCRNGAELEQRVAEG